MKYEEALGKIQGHGRFNLCLLMILSFLAFRASFEIMSVLYLNYTPEFQCTDINTNRTNFSWIWSQCEAEFLDDKTQQVTRLQCGQWRFDESVLRNTLVSEFQLVCSKTSIRTTLESVFLLGLSCGNFLGILGDRLGRKKLIVFGCLWEVIVNMTLPFVPNLWAIMALRFMWGLSMAKTYQAICMLLEIVPASKRAMYGINYWNLYVLAYMGVPLLAYLVRDWRAMQLLACIPLLAYPFMYFLPESPRWLSLKGRHDEAVDMLLYIGRYNGVELQKTDFNKLTVRKEPPISLLNLFKYRVLTEKLLLAIIALVCCSLSYIGLSFNNSFASSDIFINGLLQGSAEILAGPTAWFFSTKMSRRASMLIFFSLTCFSVLPCGFLSQTNTVTATIRAVSAIIGKFAIAVNLSIIYVYIPEIFPTPVRNSATFLIISINCIFNTLGPWINDVDSVLPFFSMTLYGVSNLLAGFAVFCFMPETKGYPLPQTMDDGVALRRGNEYNYCSGMCEDEDEDELGLVKEQW